MVSHVARVTINRIRLPILLVVSRRGKIDISLSPFASKNLVSRNVFSAVPSRVSLFISRQLMSSYRALSTVSLSVLLNVKKPNRTKVFYLN